MAAFLPVAVLLSLLVTGATAGGYGSTQTPSPSTPAPYTPPTPATPSTPTPAAPYTPPTPTTPYTPPTPATPPTPTPAPYTPQPATPPTPTPAAPYTPQPATPAPKPAHGYENDDDKKLEVVVVRVEGLVVCQSCAKQGSESLDGAAPLPGATVTVTCRDRKDRVMAYRRGVADYNGYFHVEFGVERADDYLGKDPRAVCFVRLLSSPDAKCNVVTDINRGLLGAALRDEGKQWTDGRGFRNVVYAAGPLAFKPKECAPTYHY